jgi:hypothetical protein
MEIKSQYNMDKIKYTVEQFEIDFENAYTNEQKKDVLEMALDNIDVSVPYNKEVLQKYKQELKDLYDDYKEETHVRSLVEIESGKTELYTCVKGLDQFEEGKNYHVKIEKIASELRKKWEAQGSPEKIMKAIDKMKDLVYIYHDNGIGTKINQSIISKEKFNQYFEKFKMD